MRQVDSLENRVFLDASAVLTDGVLRTLGTEVAERIDVELRVPAGNTSANAVLDVFHNRKLLGSFLNRQVSEVRAHGLGGDDTLRMPVPIEHIRLDSFGNSIIETVIPRAKAYVEGGAGKDRIYGTEQSDKLLGGAHADIIYGLGGSDRLEGGDGDDRLIGGTGRDTVNGGAGLDAFFVPSNGARHLLVTAGGTLGTEDLIAPEELQQNYQIIDPSALPGTIQIQQVAVPGR